MARKTVAVALLVGRVNRMLSAPGGTADGRIALAVLLEAVLHDTDNYRGFNYQRSEFLPADEQTDTRVLRDGYDDTRRVYYC